MRIARFGILGALVFGAIGCQTDDGGPTSRNLPPLAFVRYINAVPDTFNLTVRFIDQVALVPQTFANVPYRSQGQGGFQGVEAGTQRFRVFTYDPALGVGGAGAGTEMLADTSFNFVAGQYYTLLHAGFARAGQLPAQRVRIIEHVLPAVNTNLSVRAMHAGTGLAAGVTTVDLTVGGTALGTGVAFGGAAAAYGSRAVGVFTADFVQAGTATVLASGSPVVGDTASSSGTAIAGSTIRGSVFSAVLFGPSVPGSRAAAAATASIGWFVDRQP